MLQDPSLSEALMPTLQLLSVRIELATVRYQHQELITDVSTTSGGQGRVREVHIPSLEPSSADPCWQQPELTSSIPVQPDLPNPQ